MQEKGGEVNKLRIGLFLSTMLILGGTAQADWVKLATRLTGESTKIRRLAVKRLKKEKKLKEKLIQGMQGHHVSLALDVIAALNLKSMDKTLLEYSEFDKDGFLTVTLNSLIDTSNGKIVLKAYKERVINGAWKKRSAAAVTAMMIPLSRFGVAIPEKDIADILKHGSFELQSTTLSALRLFLIKHKKKSFLPLLKGIPKDSSYQLRAQLYFLISELPKGWRDELGDFLSCKEESFESNKKVCTDLLGKTS